jgi:hypothetical protein
MMSEEYHDNHRNTIKSQLNHQSHVENQQKSAEESKELFDQNKPNNFLSLNNNARADGQLEDTKADDVDRW